MEWKEKVELIEVAVQQLIEEKQQEKDYRESTGISSLDDSFFSVVEDGDLGDGVSDGDHRLHLLNKLLSQLESLKAEQPDPSTNATESLSPEAGKVDAKSEPVGGADEGTSGIAEQDIVKELRKVKKQNLITHCLLSAMIVLTVVWQFSEVALILKVKNTVSNPFRTVGNIFEGILKGPDNNGQDGEEEQSSIRPKLIESTSFPGLKIQDLPKMELPDFNPDGGGS